MIDELKLVRGENYYINNFITIHHPSIDDITKYGEKQYYEMVYSLCSTPSDYKVQLWDNFGIDYETVDDITMFYIMCKRYTVQDTAILFGSCDFSALELVDLNGIITLKNHVTGFTIDNAICTSITDYLRLIHGFTKRIDVCGNEQTKIYLIDKERRALQRAKNNYQSALLPMISAMINSEQFKYDYDSVWKLHIYTFIDAVKRINKIKNCDRIMQGVYAGTIDIKSLSEDNINWMGSFSNN